jgi:hypothetical protein
MQNYWLKTLVIRELMVIKNVEFMELYLCVQYDVKCVCVCCLLLKFSAGIFDTPI